MWPGLRGWMNMWWLPLDARKYQPSASSCLIKSLLCMVVIIPTEIPAPQRRRPLSPQNLQQLRLHRNLRLVVLQGGAVQKEGVFDAFTQGGDFGEQHSDFVAG